MRLGPCLPAPGGALPRGAGRRERTRSAQLCSPLCSSPLSAVGSSPFPSLLALTTWTCPVTPTLGQWARAPGGWRMNRPARAGRAAELHPATPGCESVASPHPSSLPTPGPRLPDLGLTTATAWRASHRDAVRTVAGVAGRALAGCRRWQLVSISRPLRWMPAMPLARQGCEAALSQSALFPCRCPEPLRGALANPREASSVGRDTQEAGCRRRRHQGGLAGAGPLLGPVSEADRPGLVPPVTRGRCGPLRARPLILGTRVTEPPLVPLARG